MSVKLRIKVDKDCLERSKNCTMEGKVVENRIGQNCAIARAICDIFPNSWVGMSQILFFDERGPCFSEGGHLKVSKNIAEVPLPLEAQIFISNFDNSTPEERLRMDEIEFDIEVPDEVIETLPLNKSITEALENHSNMSLISL